MSTSGQPLRDEDENDRKDDCNRGANEESGESCEEDNNGRTQQACRTGDDDFIDFDTVEILQHGRSRIGVSSGVTLEQLRQGTIIETDADADGDAEEEEGESLWWNKEELLKHLEDNPFTVDGDDDDATWEERIQRMECLIENNIWKRVIKSGSGPVITRKNAVLFHCNGYLEGLDEPFDSSVLRGRPILHRLDQDNLLPGLMTALTHMRLHEKAEIIIRPTYAFGELGCPPRIPENATVMYIVEILRIFEEGSLADFELMTPEELACVPFKEIITKCHEQRISGNTYFQGEKFREAALRYRKAIAFLERYVYKDKEEEDQANALLYKLYPNIAMTYLKLKKNRAAMVCCRKALQIDPNNLKALFQYGRAKYVNGNYDDARFYYEKALDLDPKNPSIIKGLQKLNQRIRQDEQVTRDLYKRIADRFFG